MIESTELVPSISIANLLSQRNAIVERLRQAARLFEEIEQLAESAFEGAEYNVASPSLEDRRHVRGRFPGSLEAFEKAVDVAAWDKLLHASGLWTFMDAKTRQRWCDDLEKRHVPELTEETIAATFRGLYAQRQDMFEQGVVEIFRGLSWDYKTNCPCKLGRRIILRNAVDAWGTGAKCYVSGPRYEAGNKLDDLLRVMHILDGQPEPDHRQGSFALLREAPGPVQRQVTGLHGMISLRGFKNGNAHLTFLRMDLVDKLNEIVAKQCPRVLPPKVD